MHVSFSYGLGVTSWGEDCGQPKRPGIYTDVSVFTNWVRDTSCDLGFPVDDGYSDPCPLT